MPLYFAGDGSRTRAKGIIRACQREPSVIIIIIIIMMCKADHQRNATRSYEQTITSDFDRSVDDQSTLRADSATAVDSKIVRLADLQEGLFKDLVGKSLKRGLR